jgi:hypothetical protein
MQSEVVTAEAGLEGVYGKVSLGGLGRGATAWKENLKKTPYE